MNNEDDPPELEPPLSPIWIIILLITSLCFLFYPIKTLVGAFLLYATVVGYKQDTKRRQQRAIKKEKRA